MVDDMGEGRLIDLDLTVERILELTDALDWYFDFTENGGGMRKPTKEDVLNLLYVMADELDYNPAQIVSCLGRLMLFRQPGMPNIYRVFIDVGVAPRMELIG